MLTFGGAGMYNKSASPTIKNCIIKNNRSRRWGGAFINDNSSFASRGKLNMTVENCKFINNYSERDGGAIFHTTSYSKFTLSDCKFINNRAEEEAGALFTYSGMVILNCLFESNHSVDKGGAIGLYNGGGIGSSRIINSTIVNNSGWANSGGIYLMNSLYTTITNTVLFNNGVDISNYFGDDIPIINNCAISSELDFEYTGENNITLSLNNAGDPFSPYFSDPDNDNYMIQAGSPLRNAGIWTDDVPLYDLFGLERDSLPDIGCYEYDVTSIDPDFSGTIDNCELYQNYPNPFNPSTNIRFYIDKADKVELLLYNVAGQLVKKILDEELKAGNYSVLFEASDLNSGMYYYTLKTENTKISRKMLLLK